MSKKLFVFGLLALCLVATTTVLRADEEGDEGPTMYAHVTHYRVNPAHSDEWVQLGKDWVAAFAGAEMDSTWDWYMSSNGFDYTIVDMHNDMASFDHGDEMQAKMVEAIGEDTMAGLRDTASGIDFQVVSSSVNKMRPDLSFHSGEMEGPPGFIQVSVHSVKPGMGERFEAVVKKVVDAWAQTETPGHWTTHEVTIGEGSFVMVTMAASPVAYYEAKTAPAVLTEAFGEEEKDALFAEWRDCISGYQQENWFPRADLSYIAEMHAASEEADSEGEEDGDS